MTGTVTLPDRRPIGGLWDFAVRAYRPTAAWVGVMTMLVHGVIVPLLPVFGRAPVAIDWVGVSAFLGVIFGPLVVARTVEKVRGVTS
ncbi:hypothetical protein [Brevundimonas sp.]|uniref:hypothetical protein n=1 Tax=Brevundimonas sp. TaxID=1871086 RepID=UPI0035137A77